MTLRLLLPLFLAAFIHQTAVADQIDFRRSEDFFIYDSGVVPQGVNGEGVKLTPAAPEIFPDETTTTTLANIPGAGDPVLGGPNQFLEGGARVVRLHMLHKWSEGAEATADAFRVELLDDLGVPIPGFQAVLSGGGGSGEYRELDVEWDLAGLSGPAGLRIEYVRNLDHQLVTFDPVHAGFGEVSDLHILSTVPALGPFAAGALIVGIAAVGAMWTRRRVPREASGS